MCQDTDKAVNIIKIACIFKEEEAGFKLSLIVKVWTHEPLIYKRLMSKVCGNVRHYITTAIQWSSDVRVLYW